MLFYGLNPPSKATSSCPIKTMLVTAPAKVVEKPVDVSPDLPSTSKKKKKQTSHETPQKKTLKQRDMHLRTKLWRKRHFKKPLNKAQIVFCGHSVVTLITNRDCQFHQKANSVASVKKYQCRYAIMDKTIALLIFYQSGDAYRLVSKLFALPSR